MDIAIPASFDGLPLHRAKVEPICRYAVGRAEVVGMAVTGSFAAGHPDAYSDVDLRVAVEDDALESALADRRVFADAGGTVVAMFTGEHVGAPELAIVLYDDLTHVDLHFQPAGRVGEMGRGLPAIVLWERDGRLTAQLPGADPEDPAAKLAWWEARMWTWCWYVQAKILRGEVYEALDGLGYLRATVLFPLLAMSRGRRAAGARRVEEMLGDLEQEFARTASPPDRLEAMEGLRAAVRLYRTLADPLLDRHGVPVEEAAREVASVALGRGLGWRPSP